MWLIVFVKVIFLMITAVVAVEISSVIDIKQHFCKIDYSNLESYIHC